MRSLRFLAAVIAGDDSRHQKILVASQLRQARHAQAHFPVARAHVLESVVFPKRPNSVIAEFQNSLFFCFPSPAAPAPRRRTKTPPPPPLVIDGCGGNKRCWQRQRAAPENQRRRRRQRRDRTERTFVAAAAGRSTKIPLKKAPRPRRGR